MKKLIFKRNHEDAIKPYRANASDSGLDLFTCEAKSLDPGETAIIDTGIAIHLDEGYEAQVRHRSGVTAKTKLDRKSTRLNSSHNSPSRMPSSA